MDLIFTKSETGKSWVAEFKATANFNLHIERPDKGGNLLLQQRTNGGGWDIVNDFANPRFGAIDYDCAALIYPKFIKVVSEVEPTYAAVTSAGEVTEIKSQDKSVEVTSNGTIDVTPDAGFAYLNKVSVKTNVAQSGEGGGSGKDWRYYDLTSASSQPAPIFVSLCVLIKIQGEDNEVIIPSGMATSMPFMPTIKAMAFDMGLMTNEDGNKELLTMEAYINKYDLMSMMPEGAKEITESEFYNIA